MFADPVKNLKQFGLGENMIVADLGAGTGFYSIVAAKMVPKGRVYAVEIQEDFLTSLKNKVKENSLPNVECFLGNVEKIGGTKLRDGIVDAVIVSNVFFQIENKDKFIDEIKRILKEGGRVLFIEWSDGSIINSNFRKVLPKEKVLEMFGPKGFSLDRDINAGEHHYGMILRKINI